MRHATHALLLMAALVAPGCEHEPSDLEGETAGKPASQSEGGKPAAAAGAGAAKAGSGGTRVQPPATGAGAGGKSGPQPGAAGSAGQAGAAGETSKPEEDAGPHELTLEQAMKEYKTWTQRQAEPRAISAQIFSLCRAPSAAEDAFNESVHGKYLSLLDWVNEEAARGLAAGGKPAFPVGSAIVKQKLMGAGQDTKLIALGIMIKHPNGFDPEHGGWEFGYWEEAPGLKTGDELAASCGACHAGSSTDFVFVDEGWRLP